MKCSCIMAVTCCSRQLPKGNILTHWGHVTYICVCTLTIICSYIGFQVWRQAIIWTFAQISFIATLGTDFSEIWSEIHTFSFKKMHFKKCRKWRPFCRELNALTTSGIVCHLYCQNWSDYLGVRWFFILYILQSFKVKVTKFELIKIVFLCYSNPRFTVKIEVII